MIVFYISAHGFGHATRDIEVINQIGLLAPDEPITIRSEVPQAFFEKALTRAVSLERTCTDPGVAQVDSLSLDEDETARRAAAFYGAFASHVEAEARRLRTLGASVVVGDIPPLAFAAAEGVAIPSIALGNFTWDWIYDDYPRFEHLAPGTLYLIRRAYSAASLALRLPFHGGFAPMHRVTTDVPLVARRSRIGRHAARQRLGLPQGGTVVLASFGSHGVELAYDAVVARQAMTLVLTDDERPVGTGADERIRVFSTTALTGRALRYEDLVAAADVVVSKPGYGIVSECIANDTALVYTSRGRFVEHEVFVREMPRWLRCVYIAPGDLREGRWHDAIGTVLAQSPPRERPDLTGAEVVARAILEYAS